MEQPKRGRGQPPNPLNTTDPIIRIKVRTSTHKRLKAIAQDTDLTMDEIVATMIAAAYPSRFVSQQCAN